MSEKAVRKKTEEFVFIDAPAIKDYTHYFLIPFKLGGFLDWFPETNGPKYVLNRTYVAFLLFVQLYIVIALLVYLYVKYDNLTEWIECSSECLPFMASVFTISYFSCNRREFLVLRQIMNERFVYRSIKGLTNMSMFECYRVAKTFAYVYTAWAGFSTMLYFVVPIVIHYWTKQPMETWYMVGVNGWINSALVNLRQLIGQLILSLSLGQLGIFFGCNCIIICGQLDLLCCSLKNARFTALLQSGVTHTALMSAYSNNLLDELNKYSFNKARTINPCFSHSELRNVPRKVTNLDVDSPELEPAMEAALKECARRSRQISRYVWRFNRFASPLLVIRIVQVTLYLCTLLYAASRKLDIAIFEYLLAVTLDISVYCYLGSLVTTQSDQVSMAAYQCGWVWASCSNRKLVVNLILAHRRPLVLRAARFLKMDLTTLVKIIKTSFSYFTLLVNLK